MSEDRITRPTTDEDASYYGTYINKVPERNLVDLLSERIEKASRLFASISDLKASMPAGISKNNVWPYATLDVSGDFAGLTGGW